MPLSMAQRWGYSRASNASTTCARWRDAIVLASVSRHGSCRPAASGVFAKTGNVLASVAWHASDGTYDAWVGGRSWATPTLSCTSCLGETVGTCPFQDSSIDVGTRGGSGDDGENHTMRSIFCRASKWKRDRRKMRMYLVRPVALPGQPH